MILLIYIILLPTMHTNAGEGEDVGAGRGHEKRTKELGIGKGGMYAMPFVRRYGEVKADMKKMNNNHIREEDHRFRNILGLQLKFEEYFRFCFKNRSFLGFTIYSPNNSEIKLSNVEKKNFDDGEITLILSLYTERNAASKALRELCFALYLK